MSESLTVHVFASPPDAFFVNSYWFETDAGIVVVDAQFLVSQARLLRERIGAAGKPLAAVVVTHPHPDHFNGVGTLLEGAAERVSVYATQATRDGIVAIEAQKRAEWKPVHGADYPDATVLPDRVVASGESVAIGGLDLRFDDVGPGESLNQTLVTVAGTGELFCGDLIYNRVHPWLVEGRSSAWLEQLGSVLKTFPTVERVYPGHGEPTTLLGLKEHLAYVNAFQSLVRAEVERSGAIGDEGRVAIKAEVEARFPDRPLAMLLDPNIDGVAAELTAQG